MRGDLARVVLGLALVGVGLPLAVGGLVPLAFGLGGTDSGPSLVLLGVVTTGLGVVLLAVGIWVIARSAGRGPRIERDPGPDRSGHDGDPGG